MSTGDRLLLFVGFAVTAWWFLIYAPRNRRDQVIGEFLESLAESEFESALL